MELPHVGKNCNVDSCNQLDFLPFQCEGCGKIYCSEHRLREQHSCTSPQQEQTTITAEKKVYPCSVAECDRHELAQVLCHHCGLQLCLSHRLQEDHGCTKLPQKRPDVSKTTEHVQSLLAQKNIKLPAKPTNPKAIQMAAKVALMKLKGKAIGDQGVPQEERVYFTVVMPRESRKPCLPLFFSKTWTIGKVIDVIADRASVTNNNNTSAAKKLRLFHGELGAKLQTDKTLGELMAVESVCLLSGSTIILESVSDDVQFLENLVEYSS